ncbi:MAG: hypothetical protein IKG87_13100 [Clostridia bacterium]|nr:hypothetical protein [Clostridia bacterium]
MNDRMDPLEEIRGMTPDVVAKMQEMLGNPKIPAVVKVRIMGIPTRRHFWEKIRFCFPPGHSGDRG